MKKRDLITISDLERGEIEEILGHAMKLKKDKGLKTDHLNGKTIGLVFQKPSNRTRVSFEVGTYQLGGHCIYLGPNDIHLGQRETTEDVAKTLSRYLNCIVARTFSHQDVIDLGKFADVPVINGLSDMYHPCQAFADVLTIQEHFGHLDNLTVSFIGDGNNVCHSLMYICAKLGIQMKIATPKGYEPNTNVLKTAQAFAKDSGSSITLTNSPSKAAKGADVIYADVWTSMGQEDETKKRLEDFQDFQINSALVKHAHEHFIFMHCLPAHRGEEVTAEVIDGEHAVVFDQAENRMHAEKAILIFLLCEQQND